MAKKQKVYLGIDLPWIVNILLCLVFGGILTFVERFVRGKIILGIIALVLCPIFWLVDFVSIIVNKDIKWLA